MVYVDSHGEMPRHDNSAATSFSVTVLSAINSADRYSEGILRLVADFCLVGKVANTIEKVNFTFGYKHKLSEAASSNQIQVSPSERLLLLLDDNSSFEILERIFEFEKIENRTKFQTAIGPVFLEIDELDAELGSLWVRKVLRWTLPEPKDAKNLVWAALINLMLTTPTSPSTIIINVEPAPMPPPIVIVETSADFPIPERLLESETYVCTINGQISLGVESVISDAITEIVAAESKEVWELRQICLKAAGFYKGAIDGLYGKLTKNAIDEYAAHFGVRVDWNSRVFARHLIEQAAIAFVEEN